MSLTDFLIDTEGQFCTCGRKRIPFHCRRCGSLQVFAKRSLATVIDGIEVSGFRCRRCDFEFNEATPCQVLIEPTLSGKIASTELSIDAETSELNRAAHKAFKEELITQLQLMEIMFAGRNLTRTIEENEKRKRELIQDSDSES